jgi:hypothetical protein
LLYQTLFGVWLLDTGGLLPQAAAPGNAELDIGTSSLGVFGTLGSPLSAVVLSADALTPNGDGVNDELGIGFDLLFLVERVHAELAIRDLSGSPIRRLLAQDLPAGNHQVVWDGRDGDGNLVPPGTYLCRLEVRTEAETLVRLTPFAVVY